MSEGGRESARDYLHNTASKQEGERESLRLESSKQQSSYIAYNVVYVSHGFQGFDHNTINVLLFFDR